jgi:hypothetical protein
MSEQGQNKVRTRLEKGQNKVRIRSEQGQNKYITRSDQGKNKVRTMSEQCQNKVRTICNARACLHCSRSGFILRRTKFFLSCDVLTLANLLPFELGR